METLKIFKFSDIDYTGTIQENELEIVVQPAAGALVRDKTITVYTTSGRLSVDLRLTQKEIRLNRWNLERMVRK